MKAIDIAIVCSLMFVGMQGLARQDKADPTAPDAPAVVVPSDVAALAAPFKGRLDAHPEKKAALSGILQAQAIVLERDAGRTIKDTGQLQLATGNMLRARGITGLGTVAADVNRAIAAAIGVSVTADGYEAKAIDPAMRTRLVAILTALSQAIGG